MVGIFSSVQSALRLSGAILKVQGEEWMAGRRYFSLYSMAVLYENRAAEPDAPAVGVPKEVIAV